MNNNDGGLFVEAPTLTKAQALYIASRLQEADAMNDDILSLFGVGKLNVMEQQEKMLSGNIKTAIVVAGGLKPTVDFYRQLADRLQEALDDGKE